MRPNPAGIASRYGTLEARHGLVVKTTKAAVERDDRRLTAVRSGSSTILAEPSSGNKSRLSRNRGHEVH